jgi:hypothetical protein
MCFGAGMKAVEKKIPLTLLRIGTRSCSPSSVVLWAHISDHWSVKGFRMTWVASLYVPLLLERWLHMSANSGDKNIPRLRECRGREGQNVAVRRVLLSEAIGMLGGSDGSLDQYMGGGEESPSDGSYACLPTESSSVLPCHAMIFLLVSETYDLYIL